MRYLSQGVGQTGVPGVCRTVLIRFAEKIFNCRIISDNATVGAGMIMNSSNFI